MLVKGSNDRDYPQYKSHTLGLIYDFFLYDTIRYLSEEGSDKLLFLLKWQRTNVFTTHLLHAMRNRRWSLHKGCNTERVHWKVCGRGGVQSCCVHHPPAHHPPSTCTQ